jgi:hypothetical protein
MKKSLALLLLASCTAGNPASRLGGDAATAREAIQMYVEGGPASIPELQAALKGSDPLVRRRARTALGRITGQWGSETALIWTRSMSEAVGRGKPILVLHLFGKFDEEFC